MKMKIKFKRCLVSLLSLSLLFLSCNCLGVIAAEGENSDGSQNVPVTDVTESSGEENTSSEQNTETTEASTESTQVVTDEAESNISYGDDSYVTMAAPEPSDSDVCSLYRDGVFLSYYTDIKLAIDYAKNNWNQGKYTIYLLKTDYYFSNNVMEVQQANVTIQPDPSLGEGARCTIYRNTHTGDLFTLQQTGSLTFINIVLDGQNRYNVSGRLIIGNGNLYLKNCILQNNVFDKGNGKGSAIRMEPATGKTLIIEDCYFYNNISVAAGAYGSAISAQDCKVIIRDSKFENNEVRTESQAGGGGAIFVEGDYRNAATGQIDYNLELYNVDIIGNKAYHTKYYDNDLPIRMVGGGGLYVTKHARAKIENSRIKNNYATFAGGIYLEYGRVDMKDVEITGNQAAKAAGGIYFSANVNSKRMSVQGKVIISGNDALNPQLFTSPGNVYKENGYPENPVQGFSDNIYLQNTGPWGNSAQSISLAGDLTEGSSIGITAMDSVQGGDDINVVTKNRMSEGGQFGKVIASNLPLNEDDTLVSATTYSGWGYFFRDTNGYAEDGLYLYGGPGTATSALYKDKAIVWKKGSAPVKDVTFEFTKTDEQGSPFGQNEATFEIMNPDTSSGFTKVSASTDANGKVTFTGLPVNTTYRIYETKTKLHYSLPLGYWELTVADDGTFTLKAVSQGGYMPEFAVTDNGGTKTYSLINHPQFQLPLTGGDGTGKILVIGIVVLCTPILIKLKSFRKKEKSL